jgi:hypothetical protein
MGLENNGDGSGGLEAMMNQLIEAQVIQTNLMTRLVEISGSLAQSESKEALADLINAFTESRAVASVDSAPAVAAAPPDIATAARLTVLAQYDEMRAALGRTAGAFYATAKPDRNRGIVAIETELFRSITSVTIGGHLAQFRVVGDKKLEVKDPPPEVYGNNPPPIQLCSGDRLVAIARYAVSSIRS